MGEVGNKFEYTHLEVRSIRVGSYKVTTSDVGHNMTVQVTELGFKFTLPCANFSKYFNHQKFGRKINEIF